jgi:hypothetical protein
LFNTIKTRARLSLFAMAAILISVPVWAGVTVTSPGTTSASPVHFVASASSNYPITAMRIYVDNASYYTVSANKIDTSLGMPAGPHYVVVQAWDSTGAVFKSAMNLTVSGTASTAAGVTVSSPAAGSSPGSPIHFAASARANNPITAMRIYLDNNSVYTVGASSLDTYVSASAGNHYAVVQAWDTTGAVYKSALNINVAGAASTNPTPAPSPAPAPTSSTAPSGKQYYVSPSGNDSNNGSSSSPWRTLAKAGSSVGAGSVVHVAPGTYTTGSEIKIGGSGTSNAHIMFVSDQKWGAKVVSSVGGNNTVIWITSDYVDFIGFDITGPGVMGIYITGSNDRIIGNHVHNMATSGCQAGGGILNGNYSGASNVDIIGNVVNDIGNYTQPCSTLHGIYTANPGGHIWNNIVYRNQGWGIHTWHAASQNNISNNTVVNNGYGGILVGAGDGSWVNSGSVITNNLVYQNGLMPGGNGYGIEEYGNTGHNTFQNNFVSGNGPSDWRFQNGDSASGTVTGNPLFVGYQQYGTNNDYHLQGSSPAINKGTTLDAPTYDFSGGARNQGTVDLGAYEYNAGAGAWPYMW